MWPGIRGTQQETAEQRDWHHDESDAMHVWSRVPWERENPKTCKQLTEIMVLREPKTQGAPFSITYLQPFVLFSKG